METNNGKRFNRIKRDFAAGPQEPVVTQQTSTCERHVLPRDVILKLMVKETREAPSLSPRGKCIRCRNILLSKYLILINQPWPKEPELVCRICYDPKHGDMRARETIAPRTAKRSCS
jgi:hypothetical protein